MNNSFLKIIFVFIIITAPFVLSAQRNPAKPADEAFAKQQYRHSAIRQNLPMRLLPNSNIHLPSISIKKPTQKLKRTRKKKTGSRHNLPNVTA